MIPQVLDSIESGYPSQHPTCAYIPRIGAIPKGVILSSDKVPERCRFDSLDQAEHTLEQVYHVDKIERCPVSYG